MKPSAIKFATSQVERRFGEFPDAMLPDILKLRDLIFDVASQNPAIGPLEETLKWGEPSYLTATSKSGTTIRISTDKNKAGRYGMFVHCQTSLVGRYRDLYDDVLTFEGNRAIWFETGKAMPLEAVRHCIDMALSYHLR